MKYYNITQKPLKVYGLAVSDAIQKRFWRLPQDMLERMPQYDYLGRRAVGGRVRFCTDSDRITVRMTLACAREDINIPLSGSAGADIYLGRGEGASYLGYVAPDRHVEGEITVEKTFSRAGGMEIVTVNLPRNDHLQSMEIGFDDDAQIKEAPEYTVAKPVIFYGSSITEGGCASRAGNAYASIVCRWLDADYRNFGFSGSARGERQFAEYIAGLEGISAFVYDYDHNARDVRELKETHESFFQIIRDRKPELPVLMLSRPDVDKDRGDSEERRDVIYRTYRNARDRGDSKVWFLDGGSFFGSRGRAECTVDGTHPNALGFMRMAEAVYPALKHALGEYFKQGIA